MTNPFVQVLLGVTLAACTQPAQTVLRAGPIELPRPRAAHSAIALEDNRILLVGGCTEASCEVGPESDIVDLIDPETRRGEAFGTLLGPRTGASVMRLANGRIVLAGGWAGTEVSTRVEEFDVVTRRSRLLPSLSLARSDMATVRLGDGKILLAGGYDGRGPTRIVEIFDPLTGRVTVAGALHEARAGAGAALLGDGRVLIAGGASTGMRPTAAAELFDPRTGRATPTASLSVARYKHSVVNARGRIFVVGGSDERDSRGKIGEIERFEEASGTFVVDGKLVEPRYKLDRSVLALPDGRLFVAAGWKRAEIYDPGTRRSRLVGPDIGKRLNFATATLLPGGSVLLSGGYDEQGIVMNRQAWVIDPSD